MASENETIADIVRDMRKHLKEWDDEGNPSPFTEKICDILIAAHKREVANLQMLNDNAHTITYDAVTYNENDGVNAIVKEWRERPITVHTEPEESARLDKLHNAYYAEMRKQRPRRNCDRFASYKEAVNSWNAMSEYEREKHNQSFKDWLFAPVAEGGES